jgi:hypothetical protein
VFQKDACDEVFTGKVARGGDCAVDADCVGTALCKRRDKCPGTCSALLKAGASCEKDDECEAGLSCAADGTCTAPVQVDEVCGGTVAGDCMAGLACIGEDTSKGTAGKCTSSSDIFTERLGASCDIQAGKFCMEGLSCVASLANGMVSFTCKEPVATDAACTFGVPSPCTGDQYCTADISKNQLNGSCMPLPAAGESCVSIPGSAACAPGLECDIDQLCHPVNRLGQPCQSDDGCASKHCQSGKCQRPMECTL